MAKLYHSRAAVQQEAGEEAGHGKGKGVKRGRSGGLPPAQSAAATGATGRSAMGGVATQRVGAVVPGSMRQQAGHRLDSERLGTGIPRKPGRVGKASDGAPAALPA